LAILLFPFFEICTHAPALSLVNAFAEDPYDAVGSFGIQLAPFLSLLAVLRAFRLYPSEQTPDRQRVLFARAAYCSCFSVAVTLGADMIAMLRHPSLWLERRSKNHIWDNSTNNRGTFLPWQPTLPVRTRKTVAAMGVSR
jgi:hypothetical protein